MQVIDILGHQQEAAFALGCPVGFERNKGDMGGVRLRPGCLLSPFVIEGADQIGVPLQRFWRADILNPPVFPYPAIPAKRRKAAFSRYARASEDDDVHASAMRGDAYGGNGTGLFLLFTMPFWGH